MSKTRLAIYKLKVFKRVIGISLLAVLLLNIFTPYVSAQFKGSLNTSVSGRVGEFFLDVSGYISPYASVILTSDGVVLRATVADSKGNFYISQVLINSGFSHFCLEAVDYKQIGSSETCMTIPPATGSVEIKNIFLPPTIAVQKKEIAEGSPAIVYGYTMPGAEVKLFLSNKQTITTTADETGFYRFEINNLKAGKYSLYARAYYKDKESLTPAKKIELKSLSWWEQIIAFIKDLLSKIWLYLTSLSLGPLWLAIPIIILIIILIFKLLPRGIVRPKEHIHHYWMVHE